MRLRILAVATIANIPSITFSGGQSARSFHLYYGKSADELDKLTSQIQPGALVIIDTRVLKSADLEKLKTEARAAGARLLGYLSIGEVHATETDELQRFLKEHAAESGTNSVTLESITIDRNDIFNSYRVDVRSDPLRKWMHERARLILDHGMDGLFLDTVDTVDTYITRKEWSLERRAESVGAMISLIRSLKSEFPNAYLLQNGGLNIIGGQVFIGNERGTLLPAMALSESHPFNPDGILWENAFAGTDAWSTGRFEALRRIQEAGHTHVFALGYEAAFPEPSALFEKCRSHQFIGAWAKSSEVLHEAGTIPDSGKLEAEK